MVICGSDYHVRYTISSQTSKTNFLFISYQFLWLNQTCLFRRGGLVIKDKQQLAVSVVNVLALKQD